MKRLLKVLLVFLFVCGYMPVAATPAAADISQTFTIYTPGSSTPVKFTVPYQGSLFELFKAYPEYYKLICEGDTTGNSPVIFDRKKNTVVNKDQPLEDNNEYYVKYYKPIPEIRLGMRWPTTMESISGYSMKVMENNANYSVRSIFFDAIPDGYSETFFEEGVDVYLTQVELTLKNGYMPYNYVDKTKYYLNGVLLKYDISGTKDFNPTLSYEGAYSTGPLHLNIWFFFKPDKKVGQFVDRMYNLCLGRKPDTNGYNNWVTSLMLKKKAAAQIVSGFFNSKEFKNMALDNEEFVSLCYKVMFDRSADAGGKKNWLDKLTNGVSRNFVLNGFVGSAEFHKLCAKYGITPGKINLTEPRDQNYNLTSFVARMYDLTLGRRFDVGGLNNWCKKVLDAKDRRSAIIDMAFGFFHSKEFMNMNTGNAQYVQILYNVFFDRNPDYAGWDDWVNKLKAGMSRDQVLLGFANSAEFTNVLKKFKLL